MNTMKKKMNLFKKDWTAAEADEWTYHDFWASLLGVLAYILIAVGIIGAFMLQVWGFVAVFAALILSLVMFFIIDPKLKAMSEAFDKKQGGYLEKMEKTNRWEKSDGD
jgi:hypothetical protein